MRFVRHKISDEIAVLFKRLQLRGIPLRGLSILLAEYVRKIPIHGLLGCRESGQRFHIGQLRRSGKIQIRPVPDRIKSPIDQPRTSHLAPSLMIILAEGSNQIAYGIIIITMTVQRLSRLESRSERSFLFRDPLQTRFNAVDPSRFPGGNHIQPLTVEGVSLRIHQPESVPLLRDMKVSCRFKRNGFISPISTVFRSKMRDRAVFCLFLQITDKLLCRFGFAAPILDFQLSQLINDRLYLLSQAAIWLLVR
ncbi:hypothetical protein D3C74_269090 [compost metagenome]